MFVKARENEGRTVQVQVLKFEQLEGLIELLLNLGRLVAGVPEFTCDEEFLPFDDAGHNFFEVPANLSLVLVDQSEIEMAISFDEKTYSAMDRMTLD